MTTTRDQLIRTALHAIERGMPVEIAITNAVDSALETAGLSSALQEHAPLRDVMTPAQIEDIAAIVGNRRMEQPPAKPTGKNPESPWWGREK